MTTENQVSDLDMIRHNMKVYGQETNLERAVPDLSDGLKPVHRRILYAMYKELGSKAVRDGIKSARVIGTTIGLYHPHGDCLEGDTLVPLLNGKTFRIKDLVGCGPKWVLAYDESTNKYVPAKAHSWRVGQKTKTYIQITFSDGSKKRVTKNHPFLKEKDYSWCAAENLKAGDFLVGCSLVNDIKELLEEAEHSLNLYVKKVEVLQSSELETFYDFTVDNYHNMVILTGNTKFSTRANTFCVVHNSSCYGAMTTMVNQTLPPILGIGNWGSISSPAGAMRYTNATSNNYFRSFFQPDYLKVVPKIQNYDGSTTEPLVLPALLPNILLNSTSGIGVGIRGEIPSFTPESLLKIMVRRLDGEKLTPVDYVKGLKFSHVYGGVPLKTKENAKNAVELFTNPTGKLLWTVPIKENFANKSITVDRFPPGVDPIKWVEVMRGLEDVKEVTTGAGISRIIRVHPKCNQPQFESILKEVRKSLTKSVSYAIFVTERQAVEDSDSYITNFHKLTIPQLITKWLKWRIQLEADSLDAQIAQVKEAIHKMGLIIKAALNIDIVSSCLKQKNAAETLAKSLSITVEDANFILDKKIRSLSRTDIDKLKAKRLKARDHYLALVERRKSPKTEVRNFLADMSDKFKPYVKWHGTLQTELTTSQFQSVKVDLSEDVSEDSGLPSTDESLD